MICARLDADELKYNEEKKNALQKCIAYWNYFKRSGLWRTLPYSKWMTMDFHDFFFHLYCKESVNCLLHWGWGFSLFFYCWNNLKWKYLVAESGFKRLLRVSRVRLAKKRTHLLTQKHIHHSPKQANIFHFITHAVWFAIVIRLQHPNCQQIVDYRSANSFVQSKQTKTTVNKSMHASVPTVCFRFRFQIQFERNNTTKWSILRLAGTH